MTLPMIVVLILIGLSTAVAWFSVGKNALGRGAVVVVFLSFSYWYLLPAANAFLIGFEIDQIEAKWEHMYLAFIVTGGFMSLSLLTIGAVFGVFAVPSLESIQIRPRTVMPSRRALERLSLLTLFSTVGILISRFGSDGSELLLRIVVGETSARASMEYYNVSSSVLSSLDGLWEIVNVATCSFLICLCVAARDGFGSTRMIAAISLLVMFVASGSRSTVIYVLVAIVLTRVLRPAAHQKSVTRTSRPHWTKRWPVAVLFLAAMSAAIASYASRFSDYEFGMLSAVLGGVVSHNDMLRELASVIGRIDQYHNVGAFDFSLTPFTFLLPRFLGFDKEIPEHLVIYNLDRMGIDIRYDPGNYFPGIVADFSMVFGYWGGAIAFAAFLCAISLVASWVAQRLPNRQTASAFAACSMALIFVSFRNIPGSLALSVIILMLLSLLTLKRRRG